MKRLIALCLSLLIVLPTVAQTVDPATTVFQPVSVSNVRLQLSEVDGAQLLFDAAPTVCDPLLTDVSIADEFITVNALIAPTDTECDTPVEPIVSLPDLVTEASYVLIVNNFVTRFYLTSPDDETSEEAFAAFWESETTLVQFDLLPSPINTVDITGQRDDLSITVTGEHLDGCETDEFLWLRPDDANNMLYHAEVERLLPLGVMCPAALTPYDITTDLTIPGGSILDVNGDFTRLIDGVPVAVDSQAIDIVLVEVFDMGSNYMVVVSGDQIGECAIDPESSVVERDYMTFVDIFVFAEDDAICDASPFFTDAYFVDVLPVMVNGVAYDENGMIEPINIGQGGGAMPPTTDNETDEPPSEGNFMRADTVIESVEVTVLESDPMQLELVVSGFQPDGCDFPVEVEQTVDGNDVTLHIFRNVPADVMCPAILNPYDETIAIDGTFEGGTVNIRVNDFETSVDL